MTNKKLVKEQMNIRVGAKLKKDMEGYADKDEITLTELVRSTMLDYVKKRRASEK